MNPFLDRLHSTSQPLLGIFVTLASPAVVEIAGLAGFDFVVIDLEHSSLSEADAEDLARAAQARGVFTMVRTAGNQTAAISRVVETGVDAILVPMVEDAATAQRVIAATRPPPAGTRGISSASRAAGFGTGPAVAAPMCAVEIESATGVANLDEIVSVAGLDMVFVGPGDLRASILARQHEAPTGSDAAGEVAAQLVTAVERIVARVARTDSVVLGLPPTYPVLGWDLARSIRSGVKAATIGTDVSVFGAALRALSADFGASSGADPSG